MLPKNMDDFMYDDVTTDLNITCEICCADYGHILTDQGYLCIACDMKFASQSITYDI